MKCECALLSDLLDVVTDFLGTSRCFFCSCFFFSLKHGASSQLIFGKSQSVACV